MRSLNDEHRGYMMELTATKLLSLQHDVRIYGMSATLPVGSMLLPDQSLTLTPGGILN
jgi:DNA polymerase theta